MLTLAEKLKGIPSLLRAGIKKSVRKKSLQQFRHWIAVSTEYHCTMFVILHINWCDLGLF